MVKTSPSSAGGVGSIPLQRTKIPQTSWPKKKGKQQKQYYNKFNEDFKMVHIKKLKKMEKARKWALPSTVWREHDPAHTVVLADGNDCRLLASRNVKE